MKNLSITEVTYKEIEWLDGEDYQGLQSFIEEVYSLMWNNAISNGTTITAEVKKELEDYDQAHFEKFMADFKSGKEVEDWQFSHILTDLCKLGYIEPGNYLVNIWW
jgi:hypothetical protein